jgi:hypothetical protein
MFGNEMLRCNALAVWVVLFGSLLPITAETFTIRSAPPLGRIEVRYFLTGVFGGYGGFIQDPDKDGAYSIPLQQDRKPAESLKAILYAPSCQFDILSLDLLSNPTRSATFECRHLPTISLRGRISPLPLAGERLFLTISYEAWWDHHFFGFADGMVQSFKVGTAFVQSDGHFQVQIPDFSKDLVTNEMQDASLRVLVLGHQGRTTEEEVVAPAHMRHGQLGLKILPSYDSEIPFTAVQQP